METIKYVRRADIVTADMNGETVLMDIATGKYYNLGEVGGSILAKLEQPLTFSELVEKLTAEYEVSAAQCAKDTRPFLMKMVELGLVVEA